MNVLAVFVLLALGVWIVLALKGAKNSSCSGNCSGCDGCKKKKE